MFQIDHVSVLVADAEVSRDFYQSLLGCDLQPRPDLGFPGYWLDLGEGCSIHLMQLDNPYQGANKPEHGGRDMHFALRVPSLAPYQQVLDKQKIAYRVSLSGRQAMFLRDPDGNTLELVVK